MTPAASSLTSRPNAAVSPPPAGAKTLPMLVVLGIGAVLWLTPGPPGVEPRAWHLFAIFVATIGGAILRPMPMGAVALTGLATALLTHTLTIEEALTGYANNAVWLILAAFFIAQAFIKTGLGRRIAYWFMAGFGRSTLGLSYSITAADLVLSPVIPSNTARAGGVVFPILQSMALAAFGPPDKPQAKRTSAFLTLVAANANYITCAMFLTATAANPLAMSLAADQGVSVSWGQWALASLVPGALSLLVMPMVLYRIHAPAIKDSPEAQRAAAASLGEMGPMTRDERVLCGILAALLGCWVFGSFIGVDAASAAIGGAALLLVFGVLGWDEMCKNHQAWDTYIWFAILLTMASFLGRLGFIGWFSGWVSGAIGQPSWMLGLGVVALAYYYAHYLFASSVAQVSALYVPFLIIATTLGAPTLLAALVIAFMGNLSGSLTHYATAPGAILFGAGYVSTPDWWKVGAVMSVVNLVIWLGLGPVWWRLIGIW
jgi:divalent anion:Na+ symporter, DASS family